MENSMSQISTVFFDFDGVLCTDRFFAALKPDYPHVQGWISWHVFGGEKYCDKWMRGELTYRQVNRIIAEATGISPELLDKILIDGVGRMKVNAALIRFAEKLKQKDVKIALVTNNMDVFSEITVPVKQLDKTFLIIINSFEYGLMKQDENGRLFDIALDRLGLNSFKGVLLIDDTPTYCEIFKAKGGQAYQYSNEVDLFNWAKDYAPSLD
jgi:FMN phosphatase YigB (HAD superfamily)